MLSDAHEYYRNVLVKGDSKARRPSCATCGPVKYTPEELAAAKARRAALRGKKRPKAIALRPEERIRPSSLQPAASSLKARLSMLKMTVVIPSLNEGEWLERTVRSIRENEPADIELIHVDDASDRPEPDLSRWDCRTIRLPRRMGTARARAIGMAEARASSAAIGTVDSHMLVGEGDALAALIEENERFKTIDPKRARDLQPSIWEARVSMAPAKLSTLGALAAERDALVYAGPCRQGAATLLWMNNLLRVKFFARLQAPPVVETAAANGGCYFFGRNFFGRIGGYPQLPGYFGFEEETLALLAAAHRAPILCATEISPWHVYRSQGVDPIPRPYSTAEDRELDNLAAVYRLAFGERMWRERWRKTLAENVLPKRKFPVPEHVLRSVESPSFTAYRDAVQARFLLHDEELLAEIERRMAADLEKLTIPPAALKRQSESKKTVVTLGRGDKLGVVVHAVNLPAEAERVRRSFAALGAEAANAELCIVTEEDYRDVFDKFNPAAARNIGLRKLLALGCDPIACLDADFLIPPGLIALLGDPRLRPYHVWVRGRNVSAAEARTPAWNDWLKLPPFKAGYGSCNSLSAENWRKVGGWDERCTGWGKEDDLLHEEAWEKGVYRIIFETIPLVHVAHPMRRWKAEGWNPHENAKWQHAPQPDFLAMEAAHAP